MALFRIPKLKNGLYGEFMCGGTLISDQYILSAAHCFDSDDHRLGNVTIILGEHNIEERESSTRVIRYATNIYLNGYNKADQSNDIALVRLNRPLDFNGQHSHLQPICLPTDDSIQSDGNSCMATGWGKTEETGDGGRTPSVLKEVRLPIRSNDYCRERYPQDFRWNTNICAGYDRGGRDACQGDSGGPLNCQLNNGVWVIEGITSYGRGCARVDTPGVYTKVSAYLPWIKYVTGI
ncbi:trypsin-like [Oppia nitens]|uniref:trypsin-like n=1 Tax=Oppia nitens TaxID=1686743 RepID=UPI0023D9AF3C|nr:trypsin-like [Oppia nitens]